MAIHDNTTTSSSSTMTSSAQEPAPEYRAAAEGALAPAPAPAPPVAEAEAAPAAPRKLYFAYGSNLSLVQMATRCPASEFTSIAVLKGWRWIIGLRGYANIVASDEKNDGTGEEDVVFGMLYLLDEEDERYLDVSEGVPDSYVKVMMDVEIPPGAAPGAGGGDDGRGIEKGVRGMGEVRRALVYVDQKRTGEGVCKDEYVSRINRGVRDALENGMEEWYVRRYIRPFVPEREFSGVIRDPFNVRAASSEGGKVLGGHAI